MSKKAIRSLGKRASSRLRAIRQRAADWRRRARRAVALAAITGGMAFAPSLAEAQMGQAAMAPAGGIVNRAVNGFQQLNANGPGYLYYGINAADRGLGYNGSYMTLGGFIPMAEDDLGGFWAADLRGHLSEYGGFFSNVGAVRKQFLGGTLLGIGVYWDYDGDQNQYETAGVCGTEYLGNFGHSYNQVGVSAEWLTDYGNLRSNGYMPVGTTAYTAGAPDSPFYRNYIMCQYGLDSALTGADLEVGAYIPGLSDWAGMISVGGYALGNSRYDWNVGPQTGTDVVPWFGGVYTRLDMTFVNNWDFSLQANNDSYFDWTGFARLTYRMGGSRRRNVPDQMEQPMMRNEHIVRAHQTPIVATNPDNGGQPWYVIHVNNTGSDTGSGSASNPFNNIADANAAATQNWDIVLVNAGDGTATGYNTTFSPLAANQYFIGDGSPFFIPTVCCGDINIATATNGTPLLTNPTGPSINLSNGLVTSNFNIVNSAIGISGSGNLSSGERPSFASNITITGTGSLPTQGIAITGATGEAVFETVDIEGMTKGAVVVNGGDPTITFTDGTITNTQDNILRVQNTTGGSVELVANPDTPFTETGDGILVDNAAGNVTVRSQVAGMTAATIASQKDGIGVFNSSGEMTFDDVTITKAGGSGYAGVNLQNNAGTTNFSNLGITTDGSTGFLAVNDNVINVSGNSRVNTANAPAVSLTNVSDADISFTTVKSTDSPSNGVLIDGVAGSFAVTTRLDVENAQDDGFVIRNSPDLTVTVPVTNVTTAATAPARADGIVIQNSGTSGAGAITLGKTTVTTTNGSGLVVQSSGVTTAGGTITAVGGASIAANDSDLNITLASASSTNSNGAGLALTESSGAVTIGTTSITTPAGYGITAVDNAEGFQADFGNTSVSGITNGGIGVNITNTDTTPNTAYSFDTLQVTTLNGAGLVARNGGTVNFNNPASITAGQGAAIDLENTQGTTGGVAGSGFTFLDLTSTDSLSNGVRLNNLNSDLSVLGLTAISGADGPSLSITDTVSPPAADSISFQTVTITDRNNVGMVVDGIYGQVQIGSLNISDGAGNAVTIANTTDPLDPMGTGSGRVYINGGTIAGAGGNGIQVTNALASITGASISGFGGQGILAVAGAGQETTVQVFDSQISTAVGIDGMQLRASGGGIVNGTLQSSLLDVSANALNSIVVDGASSMFLNVTNNLGTAGGPPGTGGFVLNNQAGVLQIDQASLSDLQLENAGVTVTEPGSPVTFGGSTPPVPPPTP